MNTSTSSAMIEFLDASKMSLRMAGDLLGFTPSMISHVKCGRRGASPTLKWRVEEALELASPKWVHRPALQQLYDAIVHDLRRKENPYLE